MEYVNRSVTNLRASFEDLTPQKIIRLVVIVGAYALLRPYLMKLGGKFQMRGHEAQEEPEDTAAPRAKLTPNDIRGQAGIPEDSDDGEEEEEGAEGPAIATDWGKKARRRQRHVLKELLDAEERRLAELQEDEEDKDIEEFLEKE
ncbi:DUF1531-domain-containing protein [Sodiomyces alkalinus F11]|uniref:DUF1531-domain-containing protein n=1 Tax=Sodiomyces alkalinus (strain CBS 110278 / VKM F-3762 / F11) TaxID=1314773 RepID=A0A3N2PXR4_SODAK|nr:DUF1531-domain-containing protein [Sodiomyces alkalinus F11]ROT39311.1 DUF1531-domain-containing protein [Sodiomyces alkalinus F11]